ncbi:MAG TPA: nicotinamide riboside transporter PnuC [Cyclobacteriaceae bacterium]|nr:nicotinamide riboside transporter PnuC [Cyclobacteriaceae bacterium]
MEFFDIDNIAFKILGTNVSYLEFFGVVAGGVAVWLSARAHIWSWPIGIINVILFFFLFYQAQLYPDMFLQVFYFVTNVVGWWRWANPRKGEEDLKKELKVSRLTRNEIILCCFVGIGGTLALGAFAARLHEFVPSIFSLPSAAPFQDSFITVVSIVAQYYLLQKKLESWILWLLVDILATYVYFSRDLWFSSLLYFLFCIVAMYALWNWYREYRSYQHDPGISYR